MQTRDLIGRLLHNIAETTRDQIVERSGGNPFFVLELIRSLSKRGLTEGAVTLDAMPDTVHGLILARLDLLSPKEREILQVAAVNGPERSPVAPEPSWRHATICRAPSK